MFELDKSTLHNSTYLLSIQSNQPYSQLSNFHIWNRSCAPVYIDLYFVSYLSGRFDKILFTCELGFLS